MKNRQVIISNGAFRFHLAPAAAECAARGRLERFITSGYPTPIVKKIISLIGLAKRRVVRRLLDREEPGIDIYAVGTIWSAEFIIQFGVLLGKLFGLKSLNKKIQNIGLRFYGIAACRYILFSKAKIYHYRAGYGGISIRLAKWRGMFCLCDHSAVNPLIISYLVANGGHFPPVDCVRVERGFWGGVLRDIWNSDHVLVNSDFVKLTFTEYGFPSEKISSIYLGVDDKFIRDVRDERRRGQKPRILFAGGVTRWKGFDVVAGALAKLGHLDWELYVAGEIDSDINRDYGDFLRSPSVHLMGFVSRQELAALMSSSDIFVFPSLAEGSARVVFEAMACGCYIITTPNSGSIVVDKVNGSIVAPACVDQTKEAIEFAINNVQRCREIGQANRILVASEYTQENYGARLDSLYGDLDSRRSMV